MIGIGIGLSTRSSQVKAGPFISASLLISPTSGVSGSQTTATISTVGGTGPFTYIVYNSSGVVRANSSGSGPISFAFVSGDTGYFAVVTETPTGISKTTTTQSVSVTTPTFLTVGSAAAYASGNTAVFYGTADGSPTPTYAWYVSINGAGYQYWSSASSWQSGVGTPGSTTLSAYYTVSNAAGSGTSNVASFNF